jgi:hypothetical protein
VNPLPSCVLRNLRDHGSLFNSFEPLSSFPSHNARLRDEIS